ncbi:hypothetical protein EJB05_02592, partial [Eragrostis curvula]
MAAASSLPGDSCDSGLFRGESRDSGLLHSNACESGRLPPRTTLVAFRSSSTTPAAEGSHEDISNTFVILIAMEGIGSIERSIRIGLDVSIKFDGRFLRVQMHFIH